MDDLLKAHIYYGVSLWAVVLTSILAISVEVILESWAAADYLWHNKQRKSPLETLKS
jgi:hypothetical protein